MYIHAIKGKEFHFCLHYPVRQGFSRRKSWQAVSEEKIKEQSAYERGTLSITRFDTSSVPPPGLVALEHRLARMKREAARMRAA